MCPAAVEFSVDLSLVQRLRAENSLLLQRIEQLEKVSRCCFRIYWVDFWIHSLTLGPNFITSIVCGFACCTACYTTNPQQIRKKSTTGPQQIECLQQIRKKFTTNPQQFDKSTTSLQHVYDKSTTNRSSGVWALTSWSLNCRRQNSLSRCTLSVLYTEVDARCDKLATVVGRTELTTLATVDGCDAVRSVL